MVSEAYHWSSMSYIYIRHIVGGDCYIGNPDPPSGGLYMYDGGLTVDLEWNRPSHTGGAPVVDYTVSANGQSETVSDSSEVVSYTSTGLIYGEVLVTAINSCGQESQLTSITIPVSGLCIAHHYTITSLICHLAPPDIPGLSVELNCNAILDIFPVNISWTVSVYYVHLLLYL